MPEMTNLCATCGATVPAELVQAHENSHRAQGETASFVDTLEEANVLSNVEIVLIWTFFIALGAVLGVVVVVSALT